MLSRARGLPRGPRTFRRTVRPLMLLSARLAVSRPLGVFGLLMVLLLVSSAGCQKTPTPAQDSEAAVGEPAPSPAEDAPAESVEGDTGEAAESGGTAAAARVA